MKSLCAKFSISVIALSLSAPAFAQSNLAHYRNLERANALIDNDLPDSEFPSVTEPLSMAELGLIPVEATMGIGSSRLIRSYVRGLEHAAWMRILPDETSSLDRIQAELAPMEKIFQKNGRRYRKLLAQYEDATHGHWMIVYDELRNNGVSRGEVEVRLEDFEESEVHRPKEKYFVQPDPNEASRLEPLLLNEKAKLEVFVNLPNYESTKKAAEKAERRFEKASSEYLEKSGSKYASAEARSLRAELRPLKFFRVASALVETYFIVNTVAQVAVVLDGRHPGFFPTIPLAEASPQAIKNFLDGR